MWWVGTTLHTALLSLDWSQTTLQPGWLVMGFGVMTGSVASGCLIYRLLLTPWGYPVTWREAFVLVTVPPIGKYLPGKALSVIGQAMLAKSFGIPLATTTTAALLFISLGLASGLCLGVIFWNQTTPWLQNGGVWIVAGGGLLILLHPYWYRQAINGLLQRLGREPLQANLTWAGNVHLFLLLTLTNLLYIGGAVVASLGISNLNLELLPVAIGASCLANVAGFLAFFAPAGLGVREGVLLAALTPFMDPGGAALFALSTRLIQTAADLLFALMGWSLFLWGNRRGGIIKRRDLFRDQSN
ncbi:MAG: flippase-like domain-containing protein [Magnetococcales bacterium]|nr:flippase-like domain-containing protein [Magnetococcales bacterium]